MYLARQGKNLFKHAFHYWTIWGMLTLCFFSSRGHRKHSNSLRIHQNFWKILLFKLSFNIWSQTWKYSSLWTYCAYVKSLKPFLVFNPHKISQPSGIFPHQTGYFRVLYFSSVYSLFTQFSCYFPMVLYKVHLLLFCYCILFT